MVDSHYERFKFSGLSSDNSKKHLLLDVAMCNSYRNFWSVLHSELFKSGNSAKFGYNHQEISFAISPIDQSIQAG